MRAVSLPAFHRVAAVLLLASITACGSSEGGPAEPDDAIPDFQGTYTLSGSYDGRTSGSAVGTIVITNQDEARATAEISVKLFDNGNPFFALNAQETGLSANSAPQLAVLAADGSFAVTFSGRETISGIDPASCCNYSFRFEGKLNGNRIAGRWFLTRDMPSSDSGNLTAVRN